MSMILWWLGVYGLSFLLADSSILNKPRNVTKKVGLFRELLECYFCLGFWIALCLWVGTNWSRLPSDWIQLVLTSFSSATVSYSLNRALRILESREILSTMEIKDRVSQDIFRAVDEGEHLIEEMSKAVDDDK